MKILDGRKAFFQWDVNVQITAQDFKAGEEVHFDNGTTKDALTVKTYEKDGQIVADVPNIFLAKPLPIKAYYYVENEGSERTEKTATFEVIRRAKPADYVYTETEVVTVESLIKKAISEVGDDFVPMPDNVSGTSHIVTIFKDENDKVLAELLPFSEYADEYGGDIIVKRHSGVIEIRQDWSNHEDIGDNEAISANMGHELFVPRLHDSERGIASEIENSEAFGGAVVNMGGDTYSLETINVNPQGDSIVMRDIDGNILLPRQDESEFVQEGMSVAVSGEAVYRYVEGKIGDLDTALDAILAIQESLIGGNAE